VLRAPGNIDSMSTAALSILGDQERWQSMSDLAASDARARFSENAIVPLYEALYRKAIADRPRPKSARPSA
jgi:hypothetical protein